MLPKGRLFTRHALQFGKSKVTSQKNDSRKHRADMMPEGVGSMKDLVECPFLENRMTVGSGKGTTARTNTKSE